MRVISIVFPLLQIYPKWDDTGHMVVFRPSDFGRDHNFPSAGSRSPGWIIDLNGLRVPITNVTNAIGLRPKYAPWIELLRLAYPWRLEFLFGQPEQLSVEEFKEVYLELVRRSSGFRKNTKRLIAATTYREVMASQHGTEIVDRYNPPRTMQIEVPDIK